MKEISSSHADVGTLADHLIVNNGSEFVPRGRRDTMKRVSIQEGQSSPFRESRLFPGNTSAKSGLTHQRIKWGK